MSYIGPVGAPQQRRALTLIAGHSGLRRSVEAFQNLIERSESGRCRLWWACRDETPLCAALTVINPGRTGMVFIGPTEANQAPETADLLARLTDETLQAGVCFVQAMLPRDDTAGGLFQRCGYFRLAQLIYMQRSLDELLPEIEAGLAWPRYDESRPEELAEVIPDTYVGSQDVPGLSGIRRIEDIIASHKAGGVYRPRNWWLPALNGQHVGCILLNDSSDDSGVEVVYLGVRPAFRRRGLARAILRHALTDAASRGRRLAYLAVDAANAAAARLYEQEGFYETDRREVYIKKRCTSCG